MSSPNKRNYQLLLLQNRCAWYISFQYRYRPKGKEKERIRELFYFRMKRKIIITYVEQHVDN